MTRLPLDAREVIRDALAHCEDSIERGFVARQMAERYSCTLQTIYNYAPAGRRRRADAGSRKIALADSAMRNIAALIVQSDGDVGLGDAMVVSSVDGVSVATVRRELARRGITHARLKQSRRAYRRWRAAYSNQLHQADDTVSRLYYVHRDGRIRRYDGGVGPYPNRPKERLARLYLMVLKDDHSGAVYARYFIGKHAANWLDFFFRAWSRKDDPRFVFHGVPDAIYVDQDSVFKSALCTRALSKERLGVDIKRTAPYSPESKGKVEKAIGNLAKRFESLIEFFPPEYSDVESLNRAIESYCIYRGWKPSRAVHGLEPFRVWERGMRTDRKVRLLPDEEIRMHLLMERETRVLDAYLELRLKDRDGAWHYYALKKLGAAWNGQRVEICHFADDYSRIYVSCGDDPEVMVTESAGPLCNEVGEHDGGHINPQSQAIREAATYKATAIPRFLDVLPAIAELPRIQPAGEVIDSPMFERPSPVMSRYDGQDEAERYMREVGGRAMSAEEMRAYLERFTGTVTAEDVRAWVDEILRKEAERGDDGAAAAAIGA